MYRKGERTPRQIRRDFPHFVEIEIPGSGLRGRVAVIHGWLDANAGKDSYAFTRRHERATIREWLQVRFKEPALAYAFRRAFVSGDQVMSEGYARGAMAHETARRIVIVDCEASSLAQPGVRSFPIEIAVGVPETGEIRSWLIKPEREWIDRWDWDPAAERVHGLSRDYLLGHGLPRTQVAREVREAIGPREIMSDNPLYEAHWLAVLWGEDKPPQVGSLLILYAAIAGFGEQGRAILDAAEERAMAEAPPKHRAADDVRHELVRLRELLRLADGEGWTE